MKTIFPKNNLHKPQHFVIDATGKTLGRLATEASKLLRGKESSYYTPGIDQGNFVMILNSEKVEISGKKKYQKLYYSSTQRPGSLKSEPYANLHKRLPSRVIERAIFGMLPKGVLGRNQYKRLYVYSGDTPHLKANAQTLINWKEISL